MKKIIIVSFAGLSVLAVIVGSVVVSFYYFQKHFDLKVLEIENRYLKETKELRKELQNTKRELEKANQMIQLSQYYTFLARTCGYGHEVSIPLVKTVMEHLDKNNPYGYTYSEILSLILVESGFDSKAVSKAGAIGLMQIMPRTGKEFGVENSNMLYDPIKNIETGIKILNEYTKNSGGDKILGLLKYNRGPGRVEQLIKRGESPFNTYPYKVKNTG